MRQLRNNIVRDLTHLITAFYVYTPPKRQKNKRFSDVFGGYENGILD